MKKSCLSVNVYSRRDVTDSLNGYVLLAFFLSLVLTILLIFLFIKYVTRNLLKENNREQQRNEKKNVELIKLEESESDDSEYDFDLNDETDNDDVVSRNTHKSFASEEDALIEDLETNVVCDKEKELFLIPSSNVVYDLSILSTFCNNKTVNHADNNGFSQMNKSKVQSLCNVSFINEKLSNLRKNRIVMIRFTVNYLFRSSNQKFYKDDQIKLNSKYEQLFEELSDVKDIFEEDQKLNIIKSGMRKDLDKLAFTNIDNIIDIAYDVPHLQVLKHLGISHVNSYMENSYKTIAIAFSVTIGINKSMTLFELRHLKLSEGLLSLSKDNVFVSLVTGMRREVVGMLENMESVLKISTDKINFGGIEQMKVKHEEELMQLSTELLHNKSLDLISSLSEYQTFLFELLSQQQQQMFDASNMSLIHSIKSFEETFTNIWESFLQTVSELEENLLKRLHKGLFIDNKKIIDLLGELEDTMKISEKHVNSNMLQSIDKSREYLNKERNFISTLVEIIVKKTSNELKNVKEVISDTTQSFPGISSKEQEKLKQMINMSFPGLVYNTVIVVLNDVIFSLGHHDKKQTYNVFHQLISNLHNNCHDDFNYLLSTSLLECDCFEHLNVEKVLKDYVNVIEEVIWTNSVNILNTQVCKALSQSLTTDCKGIDAVYTILSNHISEQSQNKTKNTSLFSRKQHAENELMTVEQYKLYCRMKENKVNEYSSKKENNLTRNKDKTDILSLLDLQIDVQQKKFLLSQNFQGIYNNERHYMLELLKNKIEEESVNDSFNEKVPAKTVKKQPKLRKSRKISSV